MAPQKSPPPPQRAVLNSDELRLGIQRLQKVIEAMKEIDFEKITQRYPPEIGALQTRIDDVLEKTFGKNSTQYDRYYYGATEFTSGVIVSGFSEPTVHDYIQELKENLPSCIETLVEAVRSMEEDLEELGEGEGTDSTPIEPVSKVPSRRVFIVHGHDNEAKQTVARFVERIEYEPIILHEQASGGRTVIEKIEANSDVVFAVVLLTPDDVGGKTSDAIQPRARQNVILELGYFIGLLGRSNVFAMTRGAIEVPSDFAGVVYHDLDDAGAWQRDLAKEMDDADLAVDWNKVMK